MQLNTHSEDAARGETKMSIEKDLQDLTASVRELTRLLDLVVLNAEQRAAMRGNAPAAAAPAAPETTAKADPQPQAEAQAQASAQTSAQVQKAIGKDELMQWALLQVRQTPAFKASLVEVLADYNVKTISKLQDEDVMAVYVALGGGQ
jgi:hypothetical protein